MAKGRWCTEAQRQVIQQMKNSGYSVGEIGNILKCSRKMVYNALNHIQKYRSTKNVQQCPRAKKTTPKEDSLIYRASVKNPFKSSSVIKRDVFSEFGIDVSSRTIRRRLNEKNLRGCITQSKPLVSKKNLRARIAFAHEHLEKSINFWKNVLWSDESKFCRFGSDGKKYVWRPPNMEHNPRYTLKTVKHGGGSVMVWAAFSWRGVGPIHKIDTRMDQHVYKNIILNTMIPFADDNLPLTWSFMHDNDPKHTSRLVKSCLLENGVQVLKWPAQSPDLNPIENLWNDVEQHIQVVKPKNMAELWTEIEKSWYAIPNERCRTLVESLPRRCAAVIKNKGYPTKY